MQPVLKGAPRWARFSLRTLFVLTTVIACWLGWELNMLRERNGLRNKLQQQAEYTFVALDKLTHPEPPQPSPSWLRQLLGDQPVGTIWYPPSVAETAPELVELRRVFPEAELRQWQYEPCHPGCFPAGTLVETPDGPRPVDSIKAGELVLSVSPQGRSEPAEVQSVFVTDNQLWRITFAERSLLTTETQPICRVDGLALPAGELHAGDQMLCWREGESVAEEVQAVAPTGKVERVFNLVLGDSQFFVAGGVVARSKPPKLAPRQ